MRNTMHFMWIGSTLAALICVGITGSYLHAKTAIGRAVLVNATCDLFEVGKPTGIFGGGGHPMSSFTLDGTLGPDAESGYFLRIPKGAGSFEGLSQDVYVYVKIQDYQTGPLDQDRAVPEDHVEVILGLGVGASKKKVDVVGSRPWVGMASSVTDFKNFKKLFGFDAFAITKKTDARSSLDGMNVILAHDNATYSLGCTLAPKMED